MMIKKLNFYDKKFYQTKKGDKNICQMVYITIK